MPPEADLEGDVFEAATLSWTQRLLRDVGAGTVLVALAVAGPVIAVGGTAALQWSGPPGVTTHGSLSGIPILGIVVPFVLLPVGVAIGLLHQIRSVPLPVRLGVGLAPAAVSLFLGAGAFVNGGAGSSVGLLILPLMFLPFGLAGATPGMALLFPSRNGGPAWIATGVAAIGSAVLVIAIGLFLAGASTDYAGFLGLLFGFLGAVLLSGGGHMLSEGLAFDTGPPGEVTREMSEIRTLVDGQFADGSIDQAERDGLRSRLEELGDAFTRARREQDRSDRMTRHGRLLLAFAGVFGLIGGVMVPLVLSRESRTIADEVASVAGALSIAYVVVFLVGGLVALVFARSVGSEHGNLVDEIDDRLAALREEVLTSARAQADAEE